MGKSIDPVQRLIDWLKRLERRIKSLETAPTLQNTSVTKGRLRFIGGLLLIDSGGTLQVVGTFDGNGDFTWSGPWKFDSGDGEIAGDVALTGDMSLTGNMEVKEGGTFKAGGITISEEEGGLVESDIQINIRTPALDIEGGVRVDQGAIFDGDITANSLIPITSAEAGGALPRTIVIDDLNRFRRVIP